MPKELQKDWKGMVMPTREDVLYEKTHKGVDTIHKKIFLTLSDCKGAEATRTEKLLILLIERLHEQGVIKDQDIDKMLLEIVD